jgi:uncharacterized LabA/DUF88 family protein
MKYTDKQISDRLFEMAKDRRFRPLGGVLALISLAIERNEVAEVAKLMDAYGARLRDTTLGIRAGAHNN